MKEGVFTPQDAVADAVMIALSRQVFSTYKPNNLAVTIKKGVDTELEWVLTAATRNNCVKASVTVVYELFSKHPALFRHIGLVIGSNTKDSPFKKNK